MEIKVYCKHCGEELDVNITPSTKHLELVVEPCNHCLEETRKEGWNEGNEAGYSNGLVEGRR